MLALGSPAVAEEPAVANSYGPWEAAAFAKLRELDPAWADTANAMVTSPWTRGILTRKEVELISLAVNVSCTNLNVEGTRRHIRGALAEGATTDEILFVIKMGGHVDTQLQPRRPNPPGGGKGCWRRAGPPRDPGCDAIRRPHERDWPVERRLESVF